LNVHIADITLKIKSKIKMKKKKDPRHIARQFVLQILFEKLFQDKINNITIHQLRDLETINKTEIYNKELINQLLNCINKNKKDIDKIIRNYAPKYPIETMDKTNYIILQIAICEGFIAKMTPVKASIDEAIELAKEFGADNSYKFINGVLGKLYEKGEPEKNNEN
jgi:N utilization substance protein B